MVSISVCFRPFLERWHQLLRGHRQQQLSVTDSNFFGNGAGSGATYAYYSNFFGYYAGYGATYAYFSNFFGESAGYGATNAYYSNFFGTNVEATGALIG